MKKNLICVLALVLTLFACQKNVDLSSENQKELSEEMIAKVVDETKAFSHIAFDTIVPLNEKDFPERRSKKRSSMDSYSSELNQLEGWQFYIQSKNPYNSNNTFVTTGKGLEVKLAPYSATNAAQLFYLKILPATSGIPYLLYSQKENVPIGAGSYASNPQKYVLYAASTTNPNLFGFSWDFLPSSNQDAYYIENQDLVGQGSGGWWDVYNYVLNANNGVITFAKNDGSFFQHFSLVPNDDFIIESFEYSLEGAQIISSAPSAIDGDAIINPGSYPITGQIQVNKTVKQTNQYNETTGITTKFSTTQNVSVNVLKIVDINNSYSFELGGTKTFQYGKSEEVSFTFNRSYTMTIPASTIYSWQYVVMQHSTKIPYTMRVRGIRTQRTLNIVGVMDGVDYTGGVLKITESPMANPKAITRVFEVK